MCLLLITFKQYSCSNSRGTFKILYYSTFKDDILFLKKNSVENPPPPFGGYVKMRESGVSKVTLDGAEDERKLYIYFNYQSTQSLKCKKKMHVLNQGKFTSE